MADKVALYNLADLKNTTDDALANYLNSLKFKQSHFKGDVKLGLGCAAFLVAAACFAWDYKFGFEATKVYTAIAVSTYALLNGGLTLWTLLVERGSVYTGTAPSGETISITSATTKNDPTYRLEVSVTAKEGAARRVKLVEPFAKFFDASGCFVALPFQEMLATSVAVVGRCDPKRIRSESHKLLDENPGLYDALAAAGSS